MSKWEIEIILKNSGARIYFTYEGREKESDAVYENVICKGIDSNKCLKLTNADKSSSRYVDANEIVAVKIVKTVW